MAMAGLAVASWGFARRPAECALAAGVATFALAVVPVHVLGWAGLLTAASVVGAATLLSLAILGGTLATRRGRGNLALACRSLGRLALESVRLPWKERSVALLGLVAVLTLTLWTAWLSYLAPSSAWDGVMYHEPMVGFALQNHGFAWVGYEGSNRMLGPVDGYPRVTEDLMLFLVALWDRRLIDLVPSLLYPVLLVATYVLLRRFVRSRAAALGLACGLLLIPGVVLELRSTYVDVTFLTFTAASAAFLVRRRPRAAELWMAGLSLGLLGGSKVTGLLVVPLLGLLGLVLVAREARRRPMLLLHTLGGLLLVAGLMGPTYARNWTEKHNLVWPSSVDMEPLGIHWQGPLSITNMNVPKAQAIEWFFGPPKPGEQYHDTKDNGYGNIPPFVIPPLAILALLAALYRGVRGPRREDAWILLGLTVPLLLTFALTPARHWARLNLHVVLAAWVLAAAWVGARRRRLLAEGVLGALIVGALVTLYWSEPAWDVDRERASRLSALPALERAAQRDDLFTLPPTETALARERELGDGDLVVFDHVPFLGLLWNERFSNRVELLDPREHPGARWMEDAIEAGAEWAVVAHGSSRAAQLTASPAWEEVGPLGGTRDAPRVFRRTSMRDRPETEDETGDERDPADDEAADEAAGAGGDANGDAPSDGTAPADPHEDSAERAARGADANAAADEENGSGQPAANPDAPGGAGDDPASPDAPAGANEAPGEP